MPENTEIILGFTGHLDCRTLEEELEKIHAEHTGALWVYGAAKYGFDLQVKRFCAKHKIRLKPFNPDFKANGIPAAYFVRDRLIAVACSKLYACYDGRTRGGTRFTRKQALDMGKTVIDLPAFRLPESQIPPYRRKASGRIAKGRRSEPNRQRSFLP